MLRAGALLGTGAILLAGCGGPARQDEDEPSGRYPVEITEAKFPKEQKLAKSSRIKIGVRNVGTKVIPNVAVTLSTGVGGASSGEESEGLDYADPGNEDISKPIFVIDTEPRGGQTSYRETWALGELRPGQTKTFAWDVTAVEARPYDIKYRVAAGLDGKAKAVLPDGGVPGGRFAGKVDGRAPEAKVADKDGEDILKTGERVEPRAPKN